MSAFFNIQDETMEKPKITVIVPYWNAEKWIAGCARSLKDQEGPFEFIFVNDHSTDNSYGVLKQVTEGDGRFIRITEASGDGHGVSWARNAGLDIARGEWVTFLDADDEMLPDAGMIYRFMTALDDTINMVQANHMGLFLTNTPENRFWNERGEYHANRLPRSWCMVWNKIYRRSFLEKYGIRFKEGVQYGEDELFNLECLTHDDRILCTQRNTCTVLHRYNNPESLSHKKTAAQLLQQTREIENYIEKCDSARVRLAICQMMTDRWSRRLPEVFK